MTTIAACILHAHYSITEQEAVVLPTTVAFGTRQINTTTTLPITISPASGINSDVVQTIAEQSGGCPDFNFTGPANPNAPITSSCADYACTTFNTQSYTFNVTFNPTVIGPQSCTLNLMISGQPRTINLTGTGQAPPIDVELETGTATNTTRCTSCMLDFGQTNVNTTSPPQVAKVLNIGSGTATLISVSTAAPFQVTGNLTNRPLGPNGVPSESYNVTCRPTAAGLATGTLAIVTNDPAMPNQSISLKCEGIMSDLSVPGAVNLGPVRVGDVATSTLRIDNTGTAALTINSIAIDNPEIDLTGISKVSNTVINPGQGVNTTVSYSPTMAKDNAVGLITLSFDGTETRVITVNAPAVDTTLSLAPTGPGGMANLGAVCIGTSATERFTLIANSAGSFELEEINVLGLGVFSHSVVAPSTLPATVEGNASNKLEFDIAYAPTSAETVTGAVTLITDIPTGDSSFLIGLTGTGLPSGQNVTPVGPVDFGTVATGQSSATAQKITLTNCSADALTISRSEITGDQDFQISAMPETEVPANGQAEFEIVLAPEFGGVKRGELEIEYAGGISRVVLIGNGDGPLRPIDDDDLDSPRDSYYACSTGDAGGSWLLVLAIGFVARRRRQRRRYHS